MGNRNNSTWTIFIFFAKLPSLRPACFPLSENYFDPTWNPENQWTLISFDFRERYLYSKILKSNGDPSCLNRYFVLHWWNIELHRKQRGHLNKQSFIKIVLTWCDVLRCWFFFLMNKILSYPFHKRFLKSSLPYKLVGIFFYLVRKRVALGAQLSPL